MHSSCGPTCQQLQFSFVGLDEDVLSGCCSAGADGVMDGHFRLGLNVESAIEITSIAVYGADATGTKNGYVWHSASSQYWVLGVRNNGTLLTPPYQPTLGQFSGPVTLDLYATDIGHFRSGNSVLVEVTVAGQAQPLTTLIQLP